MKRKEPKKTEKTAREGNDAAHEEILANNEERQSANQEFYHRALVAEQRSDSILNSLISHVAVLGPDGTILQTNDSWDRFAQAEGSAPLHTIGPGANYLDVCRKAIAGGLPEAQAAVEGLQAVLAGQRDSFRTEYSCDSGQQQLWFVMYVTPLKGQPGAVVSHFDVTARKLAELAAQRNESIVQALLNSTTQSIVATDSTGTIMIANGNTEKMFGFKRSELLGQPLDTLIPVEVRGRHAEHHRNFFEKGISRPMGQGMELQGRRKDGTLFPVEIGLGLVETPKGKLGVAFVNDITQRRNLEIVAERNAREVRALAASLLTAQEEERRRVSRELHDQTCQQLASLAIDIGGLAANPVLRKDMRAELKALQARAVKTSEETRHLAYELHPSVLEDLGLVASLRALCKESSGREGFHAEFTNRGLPGAIPREVASCFYRVAQESLHNVVTHSGAKRATVELTWQAGILTLTVEDNGIGFDPEAVKGQGQLGLVGIEERARLIHGKLSIASRPGNGTRIALEVPLLGKNG